MNEQALSSLLKGYGKTKSLFAGRAVHTHLSEHGLDRTALFGNLLIEMYGLCACPQDAQSAFDHILTPNILSWNILVKSYGLNGHVSLACHTFFHMPSRDVVSWNAIISSLSQNGCGLEALQAFNHMLLACQLPDKVTFVCVLDACAGIVSIQDARCVHVVILANGCERDVVVGTALVNLYGKCKALDSARHVFSRLRPDTISWNAMISVASQNNCGQLALDLFYQMQVQGFEPNKATFVCALGACANLASHEDDLKIYELGAILHAAIVIDHWEGDVGVATALVTLYGRCKSLSDAKSIFFSTTQRNVVSWNAMISAFSQNGRSKDALLLFGQMLHEHGVVLDRISYVGCLDACASAVFLDEGRKVHATIVEGGFDNELEVGNKLVSMYAGCGSLDDATTVFDKMILKDIVSWNTMVAAFVQSGCLDSASNLFLRMPGRDTASWNTLIAAYSQNGLGREALILIREMVLNGFKPNDVTFLGALDACAVCVDLDGGEAIHGAIVCSERDKNEVVGNALINMYGKCGSQDNAWGVFNRKSYRDVVSWNAMIGAVALNGNGEDTLSLFIKMQLEGKRPNAATFVCVLVACNYSGSVDDGKMLLLCMSNFDIPYTLDHLMCMIDLLGRAGHLEEAEGLINTAPFQDGNVPWFCLLGACNIHNDAARGERTATFCLQTDPNYASPYVTLSNIYAGRWQEVD